MPAESPGAQPAEQAVLQADIHADQVDHVGDLGQ